MQIVNKMSSPTLPPSMWPRGVGTKCSAAAVHIPVRGGSPWSFRNVAKNAKLSLKNNTCKVSKDTDQIDFKLKMTMVLAKIAIGALMSKRGKDFSKNGYCSTKRVNI